MADEKLMVEVTGQPLSIGQVIYVPQRDGAVKRNIIGWRIGVYGDTPLSGAVDSYYVSDYVQVRIVDISTSTIEVSRKDIYVDGKEAEEESKFLEVIADDEAWRLAIGDREVTDENSPYHISNSGLPPCCKNTPDSRDILAYCRRNDGLIVHDANILSRSLLACWDFKCENENPLGRILEKLKIEF